MPLPEIAGSPECPFGWAPPSPRLTRSVLPESAVTNTSSVATVSLPEVRLVAWER